MKNEPTNFAANYLQFLSQSSLFVPYRVDMITGTPSAVLFTPTTASVAQTDATIGSSTTNCCTGSIGGDSIQVPLSQRRFENYCALRSAVESLKTTKEPVCLAQPVDQYKLSDHQQFLRYQIELFQASDDEVSTHTRGRNKRINVGQVGIRCRHCAHLPPSHRQKGSVYFPATIMGIYQAAQNMSTAHIQCGLCSEMPDRIKEHFKDLIATKAFTTGSGRPYWAKCVKDMGLVDTNKGIRYSDDIPIGTELIMEEVKK